MDEKDKKVLLSIARESIESAITDTPNEQVQIEITSPGLKEKSGAFVTLRTHKRLRGCIGRMVSDIPLHKLVSEMAVSAAKEDTRFSQIKSSELEDLEIDISVLSPLQKIDDPLNLELGTHGIYIKKGHSTGCFLPQVATETGWTKEEFLSQCCSMKAKISPDAWKKKNVDIYIFTSEMVSEKFNKNG
ncbi:MAG: AmmeMemoRadiSam system protein A [Candidatus Scalindua sp.]|jgi:AmmeMemoRadiSam system protein A|nr:AmmeMemoRadiSam system protein A [Candidatus Scalindua sp.]MBT7210493.1 AmmeMemoRadiSam system protein A [Candidatus Scalindua sp.]MBT7592893.1 AmmeMemoRadiSam system protein A [Candidatus Scalindua sp.]